ncbi:MAG: hypothetical protein C0404_04135 [Verrucomicrobia bacterium]|nr:hypothetical protein [Verrucomicrobiota bacterium]
MAKKPLRIYKNTESTPPPPASPPASSVRAHPATVNRKAVQVYKDAVDRDRMSITQQVVEMPETPSTGMTEAELHKSKYDELLHTIYDTVVITDSAGKILESNIRAQHHFLLTAGDLLQMNVIELIAGSDEHLLEVIRHNVSDKRFTIIEAICMRGDGSRFNGEIVVNKFVAIPNSELCFFLRDISARKKAEEDLKQAGDKLIEAEKVGARIETLSTIFYELNNPLQILMCMAELDKNREYKKQLDRIIAVLESLRKNEQLEEIVDEDGTKRFNIPRHTELEPSNKQKILVVEDEKVIREIFVNALVPGFPNASVDSATNGREAFEVFAKQHSGVIVMDVSMPIMNGEEAYDAIKTHCDAHGWEMPSVIFCTGFVISENIQAVCKSTSSCVCMKKPLSITDLIETVGRFLPK